MNRYLFLLVHFLWYSSVYADDHISIQNAYIAEAPTTVNINAGYLTIENHSDLIMTLISISSHEHDRIEIHKSVIENGMAMMEHHQELAIPSKSKIEMLPGGFHLMIYNDGNTPGLGSHVPVKFSFSDGTEINLNIEVINDRTIEHNVQHDNPEPESIMSYQHFLPQHFLSSLMYKLARMTWVPLKNLMINKFIRFYDVDMTIAEQSDYRNFPTFNDFFTRQLKPESRKIDTTSGSIVSPVDGSISQFGKIQGDAILQAKGKKYTVSALLGNNEELADQFNNGAFVTVYLSPKDYHRIHMPLDGKLNTMSYVPGKLFSVSKTTTNQVNNLFAINERIVNVFDTEIGSVVMVMVGAIFVGSMETIWEGEVTPASNSEPFSQNYQTQQIHIAKGDEMGRFNMGSTVILLFEADKISFEPEVTWDASVVMGQKIANITNNSVNVNN